GKFLLFVCPNLVPLMQSPSQLTAQTSMWSGFQRLDLRGGLCSCAPCAPKPIDLQKREGAEKGAFAPRRFGDTACANAKNPLFAHRACATCQNRAGSTETAVLPFKYEDEIPTGVFSLLDTSSPDGPPDSHPARRAHNPFPRRST